mmetsp:Transcript_12568/g.30383  ORF Transcript_12568/g.30383 Transcript_12568/m.30383 type:complete len:82 (+) Transcript_12568:3168-3413(+)
MEMKTAAVVDDAQNSTVSNQKPAIEWDWLIGGSTVIVRLVDWLVNDEFVCVCDKSSCNSSELTDSITTDSVAAADSDGMCA